MPPSFIWEKKLGAPQTLIAGIDEVGRGALAGDVYAGAVILSDDKIKGIDDSKKLSAKKRDEIFIQLEAQADIAIGAASAKEIDQLGIVPATFLAMERAVKALAQRPDALLVDGTKVPPALAARFTAQAIVRGDGLSLSIAAASIVAKVSRDKKMKALAEAFPLYHWHSNVGYGSKAHLKAIEEHGASPYHRFSFSPLNA
jgi:ribonuclease HII